MNKKPILLIVDDDKDTLASLSSFTKKAGYETYCVSSEKECFDFLKNTKPNLILLDVHLDGDNGIEICSHIKSQKEFKDIHILLISGISKSSQIITKGLNAGANGFIAKPVNGNELVARLDVFRRIQKAENEIKIQSREIQEQSEEIQSLNEELLAQNEELRKVNLQLETLNNEKTSAIRELKQSELELTDTKTLLETIIDSIPDIIGLQDKNHNMIRYNKAGYEFLGLSPDEVKGKKCYELINRITQCEDCATSKCFKSKKPESIIKYTKELDAWHDVRAYPVLDDNGEIKYVVEHLSDITAVKKQEKQIQKAKQDWQNIFNAIGQPAIILDKNHNLLQANDAVIEKTGKSFEELKKLKCYEIFHGKGEKTPAKGCPAQMLMKSGDIKPVVMEMEAFGGFYMVSCTPITNGNNEVEGIIHIATDITQRVEAEKQIKEREKTLQMLLENIPFAVYAHTMDGKLKIVNKSSEKQSGYNRKELLKLSVADLDKESVTRNDREKIWMQNKGGTFSTIFSDHIRKDGSTFPVEVNITAIKLNNELFNLAIVQDISDRKAAQKTIEDSEKRYRTIFENFPNGAVFMFDKNMNYTYVDGQALRKQNLNKDDLIGKSPEMVFPPETANVVMKNATKVFDGEDIFYEVSYNNKIYSNWGIPLYDSEGKISEGIVITYDITEIKTIQKELEESELRYRTLVSNFPDGIIIHNGKEIKYANHIVANVIGINPEALAGLHVNKLFQMEAMQNMFNRIEDYLKGKPVQYPIEDDIVLKDGKKFPVEIFASRTIFEGENCLQVILRDISKRKEVERKEKELFENLEKEIGERTKELDEKRKSLEDSQSALIYLLEDVNESRNELEKLNNDLKAINKELESFSYSISHDLRAPLTRMDGFTKIIEDEYSEKLDEQGKHYLKRIRYSCGHLGNLIDDVLTLSRITRHKLIVKEVNLSEIIQGQVNDLVESAPERKTNIKISKDIIVNCDKTLFTVLLQNLIDNAWKFTQKNDETIIEFGSLTSDNETVYYIKDNGVGFNMNYYENLFIPFQRLHKATDYPGTGVGLATVQRIINRHGGRIWAESEIGKGSAFYFTLK